MCFEYATDHYKPSKPAKYTNPGHCVARQDNTGEKTGQVGGGGGGLWFINHFAISDFFTCTTPLLQAGLQNAKPKKYKIVLFYFDYWFMSALIMP